MFISKRTKNSISFLETALLTACIFSLSFAQVRSLTPNQFTLPVSINTYGNAWEGNLTYGLVQFNVSSQVSESYLVVMNTDGGLEYLRTSSDWSYFLVKYLNADTVMFSGEPGNSAPGYNMGATHFLNLATDVTADFPNVWGHHDMEYDPLTDTFLTLRNSVEDDNGTNVLLDQLVELDAGGNVLWTWDTYDYLPLSWADPLQDTAVINGTLVLDFAHCNDIQWDYQQNVVYLNSRHLDTFFKINMTTGNIIWACGLHGNFTLLDAGGNKVSSLWYGSHDLKEVEPDVFMMFDNDFHNLTNPNDAHSRILEITLDEQNMTARESWSWEAPQEYWSPYWGEADILPNGDRIGTFGTFTKQYNSTIGAVVVEVNPSGQVVRTWTFPVDWGIYRVVVTAFHDVAITGVASAKALVGQGYDLNITVRAADSGDYTETFSVAGYANTTHIASQNVTLSSGNSADVGLTWNTTGFAFGNYTLSARGSPIIGQLNTTNDNFTGGSITVSIPGDLNGDFKVSLADLAILAQAYGSKLGDSNWNPNADIDSNGIVGLSDLVALAQHYGQHHP
jgi:hypothetical protein